MIYLYIPEIVKPRKILGIQKNTKFKKQARGL